MSDRYSAAHTSLRTAGIMVVFTLAFTAMMSQTYRMTRPAIEASAQDEKMRLIDDVLPRGSYDNALLDDFVAVGPTPQLGLEAGGHVYRARRDGTPAALVFEAVARDGYGGKIQLVVAVSADGRLGGVRVTGHKETPGLGDYIDPKKDRNKSQPWIGQFAGVSLADVAPDPWKVRRDGGRFAYRVGATISARAVTNAAGRAVEYATENRDALFAAPAGSRI